VGITRKYLSTPPFFVEIGHDYPASLPEEWLICRRRGGACAGAVDSIGDRPMLS